jgi:hypothetical protein
MSGEELIAALNARVDALEARQRELEDEREIRDLVGLYGALADTGSDEEFLELFTDDAGLEIHGGDHSGTYGALEVWEGKERLREFITDPRVHQRLVGRCMHLPSVRMRTQIDGDDATAESCALVLVREGAEKVVYEAGFTRWHLRREHGRWRIRRRVRYGIGTPGHTVMVNA